MFRELRPDDEKTVEIVIDGIPCRAYPGESVASVLLRTPPFTSRTHPVNGESRAPFCMMGVCFDCMAIVNGDASTQTCMIEVADGMRINRQGGYRQVNDAEL